MAADGGGALVGYHLHHRYTDDLDLFTRPPAGLPDGERALRAGADALGAALEVKQSAPDLRRFLVVRGDERTVVDLVVDRVPGAPPEEAPDGVLVDTLAWVLSGFRIPASAPSPRGATASDLLGFRDELVQGLVHRTIPPG